RFLMTREVAHYQMFEAALSTIQPNFPPGILQSDPRYSNLYFNFSNGNDFRGPWNEGESTQLGETFQYIEDPVKHVMETNALIDQKATGTDRTESKIQKMNSNLSHVRREEINSASPAGEQQWNTYSGNGSKNYNGNGKDKNSGKNLSSKKSINGKPANGKSKTSSSRSK
ncbi:MAG TPA: manganese catalase family protein, partial [Ginsengibacter sp.]|nr:manganese catalase family protein [Ginsengibacter sp.]